MKRAIKIDVSYTSNKEFDKLDPRPDPFRGDNVAVVYGYNGDAEDGNIQNGYWYGKTNCEALGRAVMNLSCLPNAVESRPLNINCLD